MNQIPDRPSGQSPQEHSGYDEVTYWRLREDPNSPEGREPEHLRRIVDYVRARTEGAKRVLELGPGIGRTLEAHPPGRRVVGYDISERYRERVVGRAAELGLEFTLDIAHTAGGPYPYADEEFDAGVSCQVFLHQRPETIGKVMEEMARVCRKVVVVTGGYRMTGAAHVFDHDYPAIATGLGYELNHVRAWPPHLFFEYGRRSDAD